MASDDPTRLTGPRSVSDVRAELERARLQVYDSIEALRADVRASVDWRSWVRAKPWTFIGGAFTLGLLLGMGTRRDG